jgi:hypothetical protein
LWALPKEQLRGWDCYLDAPSYVHLELKHNDKFDKNSAAKIGWLARIDHYSNLISHAQADDYACTLIGSSVLPTGSTVGDGQYLTQLPFILCDFFKLLSILDGDDVTQTFLSRFRDSCSLLRKSFENATEIDIQEMAIIVALLKQIGIETGVRDRGISASVLELMSFVALRFVRSAP